MLFLQELLQGKASEGQSEARKVWFVGRVKQVGMKEMFGQAKAAERKEGRCAGAVLGRAAGCSSPGTDREQR